MTFQAMKIHLMNTSYAESACCSLNAQTVRHNLHSHKTTEMFNTPASTESSSTMAYKDHAFVAYNDYVKKDPTLMACDALQAES